MLTHFQGLLREPPEEVEKIGDTFGNGVYFADMMSKSAYYSLIGMGNKGQALLLLCDVALGET